MLVTSGSTSPGGLTNGPPDVFVDLAGGNYRLSDSSPYKNGGVDGTDIGADIDAIAAATGLPL
jgi:hypothetical protein